MRFLAPYLLSALVASAAGTVSNLDSYSEWMWANVISGRVQQFTIPYGSSNQYVGGDHLLHSMASVTNGATGPQGIQGVPGVNGTNGLNGVNGTNGLTGATGATGAQGPAGSNANVTFLSVTQALGLMPVSQSVTSGLLASGVASTLYYPLNSNPSGYLSNMNALSFTNGVTHAIVSVAAAANGFQVSAAHPSRIAYTVSTTTTATILAGQNGYVVLEICSSNSATAANWVAVSRTGNSQAYSLAAVIQGVQTITAHVGTDLPPGWFARLRSVNVLGSPVYSCDTGQEAVYP